MTFIKRFILLTILGLGLGPGPLSSLLHAKLANFRCDLRVGEFKHYSNVRIYQGKDNAYYVESEEDDFKQFLIGTSEHPETSVQANDKRIRIRHSNVHGRSYPTWYITSTFYMNIRKGEGYFRKKIYYNHEMSYDEVWVRRDLKFENCTSDGQSALTSDSD